jgi:hypothetical protein
MNEADKQYIAFDKPDEEHLDTWEFLAQQIKGLVAFAAIVVGLWMIVAAVVLK